MILVPEELSTRKFRPRKTGAEGYTNGRSGFGKEIFRVSKKTDGVPRGPGRRGRRKTANFKDRNRAPLSRIFPAAVYPTVSATPLRVSAIESGRAVESGDFSSRNRNSRLDGSSSLIHSFVHFMPAITFFL